ncbi:hypothetical protein FA13DRAFT_1646014 [Coprinellus micaceus]|uniref:CxC6 like cysteine cluster associated with KDZ domain-containing protein n=1 Tax=Coprinellus micaceus TaxID=71717 RepID=A0A4Y7SEH1_COPMI|nr:hypothetical protein FA13DRAFT_1646014 [Coprinellus micaceus]
MEPVPLILSGFHCLLPPTRTCLDPKCVQYTNHQQGASRPQELSDPRSTKVTIFSRDYGPLPGTRISLYCRRCHTRYHHNYYIHDGASRRTYYLTPPHYIHATDTVFVDKGTCEMFTAMMLNAWTSAGNCAQVYNTSIANTEFQHLLPARWLRLKLDVELVWNALFLYWLLEDSLENGITLELEQKANHTIRLSKGLKERNKRFAGTGQPEWNHACDSCCWLSKDKDGVVGAVRSVVIDGISIGRPCCGHHDCPNPLPSVKSRFCYEHDHLNRRCCVTTCSAQVERGFQTCSNPIHRKLETWVHEQNKAMFQLKRRSAKAGAGAPQGAVEEEDGEDEFEIDIIDIHCEGKPEAGNCKVKARFGRRRTHNEELAVYSCGIIVGRATFYGSEAPNGVKLFLKGLFPTKRSLPQVIWHDNNCKIQAVLCADSDPTDLKYFEGSAMPVDVFHFKSKHKESDTACNEHCNPADWDELITEDGKWRFNSSAAEQANVWFGRYLPIVREMEATRYNFFLDEMIKRRNRATVRELRIKEKSPYSIPRSSLLG